MSDTAAAKKSYNVGIICALALEKAAVEAMLDEEHPRAARVDGDDNDYTFGQIGGHNVAVACLPAGGMGKVNAATVARDMMRSFPIKIGLMVGIGGGVWSTRTDVRLGDVVVSQPTEMHGGVVQWDFGKLEKDGIFRRTGTLNKPPRALLSVLQTLKSYDMRKGNDLPKHISQAYSKWPRMAKTCSHLGAEQDKLYDTDYAHDHGETCDDCDDDRLVTRSSRDDTDPVIHYGNIASGDEVVKDGPSRDRIAHAEKVICFEMEAAGLMDNFPCVVIRGICDYADTHKNKDWQGYAAFTAAAYATWLLEVMEPTEMIDLPTVSKSA